MTKLGAVFWGGLVLASGFATFNVKYAVQGFEDELTRVRRQTNAEQQEIRVLSAEWAYLNQPDRLAQLNRNFLQLAPMTAKQLQGRVEEIALRPVQAGIADTMIAAGIAAGIAANPAAGSRLAAMPAVASPPAVALAAAASSAPPLAAAPVRATRAAGSQLAEIVVTAEAPAGGERAADARGIDARGIDAYGTDTQGKDTRRANPRSAGAADAARATGDSADRAAALAEALHLLGADIGGQTPRVRLVKAAPVSLDGLISRIADTR